MKEKAQEPSIETAKEIATKFNKEIAIVITLEKGGRLQVNSYGEDRAACACAGKLAEACFTTIMDKWKGAAQKLQEDKPSKVKLFTPKIITPNELN